MNNSKQLGLAWHLYSDDNAGRLVNNGVFNGWQLTRARRPLCHRNPNWVYGLMEWSASLTSPTLSSLPTGCSFLTPEHQALQVPADRYLSRRQSSAGFTERVRSISMNAFVEGSALLANTGFGICSYAKEGDLIAPVPSQLWVFADENADTVTTAG